MPHIRKDAIGAEISITVPEAADATLATLRLLKPSGAKVDVTPVKTVVGTDAVFTYTTIDGDLDESGPWMGQVDLTFASASIASDPFTFSVGENL